MATGAGDGEIFFWSSRCERAIGALKGAHEGMVLTLDWHPLGHCLASGSADMTVRFWVRARPGDSGLDGYVLGKGVAEAMGIKSSEPVISVAEDDYDREGGVIPGMRRGREGGYNRDARDSREGGYGANRDNRGYSGYNRDSRDYAPNRDYSQNAPNRDHSSQRDSNARNNAPPPPPPPSSSRRY